jgi:hypothetical protein
MAANDRPSNLTPPPAAHNAESGPGKEPAPAPKKDAYASHLQHADRMIHYELLERLAKVPRSRRSWWRRLLAYLTGR